MLTLTKESTNKDRSLKTQLTISSKSSKEKISGDRMWTKDGFFKDTIPELNLEKKKYSGKFPFLYQPVVHFNCQKW